MDIETWLYVVIGAIYLVSRALKSKKKHQQPIEPQGEDTQKEVTFEDLLKEFTQGHQEENENDAVPEPEVDEPSYELPQKVNTWRGSDEEATSVYERSIREAERRDAIQDSMKNKGHSHHLQRFTVFEEEEEDPFLNELRNEIQQENSMKKAVIYKEILDRRHF